MGKYIEKELNKTSGWALIKNPWYQFVDENGTGHCSPDLVLIGQNELIILEVKLSQTPRADHQLAKTYKPILEYHYGLPVIMVQVCRNIRTQPERSIRGLRGLLVGGADFHDKILTWHLTI